MINEEQQEIGLSQEKVVEAVDFLIAKAHGNAVVKGWWEENRSDGEIVALIHSELSEALEGFRYNNPRSPKIPEFTCVEEEYADVVIRILDHCGRKGYRLAEAILAKMEHNETRPYKYGKAF